MITLATYTHTNCRDIWPMYFGQLDKYLPEWESHVLCNHHHQYGRHQFHQYQGSYWKAYCDLLEGLTCRYFVYMQEDFVLMGEVDSKQMEYYLDFLDVSGYSYLRLIANDLMGFDHIVGDIYNAPVWHPLFFSMQATIWNRQHFIDLYKQVKAVEFGEWPAYSHAAKHLGLKGSFCYQGQKKKGRYHYDSPVFPVMATAIVKKRWNMEYIDQIRLLAQQYNIDLTKR